MAKEKVAKERPPYRVGLRRFCALQLRAGAAELAIAQTILALFRTKLPVLDNTKGVVRSKQNQNQSVTSNAALQALRSFFRHTGAGRYPEWKVKWIPARGMPE